MSNTKARIVEALDALSEDRQREVLEYVESLCSQEGTRSGNGERDSEENPLLEFIGGVKDGSLAQNIDEELYGE